MFVEYFAVADFDQGSGGVVSTQFVLSRGLKKNLHRKSARSAATRMIQANATTFFESWQVWLQYSCS